LNHAAKVHLPKPCLPAIAALLSLALAACDGTRSGVDIDSMRTNRVFKLNDADGDNRISADEWPRMQSVFRTIDTDGDGYLTKKELKAFFAAGGGPPPGTRMTGGGVGPALEGQVRLSEIDKDTLRAFRARLSDPMSQQRGLLESRLQPVYPDGFSCPRIDHIFGEEWRGPVPDSIHTGADIPAGWYEPIYAMADGQVVAKFTGEEGYRGLQIVLRHTPAETGLPVWVYTLYSHFDKMPELKIGDRIRMGDYLGPNGKTGVPVKGREPHLHLTIYYSTSPQYAVTPNFIFPMKVHFTDPVALFRGQMPLHPAELRKLPDDRKRVAIVYKTKSGQISKLGARIIWPYVCG